MLIVVDNSLGDSVAHLPYLIRYLRNRNIRYTIVSSIDEFNRVPTERIHGIILSGSPLMVTQKSIDAHSDQFALNIAALSRYDVPILGICFGAQFINHVYGGSLRRLRSPFCKNGTVRDMNAFFCLHYVIDRPALTVHGTSIIEGRRVPSLLAHPLRPLFACLFHPEVNAETHIILDDFLIKCRL
jgi:anthranilate/para-aminobenzoate synthase component II